MAAINKTYADLVFTMLEGQPLAGGGGGTGEGVGSGDGGLEMLTRYYPKRGQKIRDAEKYGVDRFPAMSPGPGAFAARYRKYDLDVDVVAAAGRRPRSPYLNRFFCISLQRPPDPVAWPETYPHRTFLRL